MKTVTRMALACLTAFAAVSQAAAPAHASRAVTGTLAFAGTVHVPTFPCAAPAPGQFPCVGSFTASTGGTIRGIHGESLWDVSLNAVTNGSFSYADNISPGVPCSEGTARGTASLDTAQSGQAFGTYQSGNNLITVRNVALSYSFSWVRVGATAVLSISNVVITLELQAIGHVTVLTGGTALAATTFIPSPDSAAPTGCAGGATTSLRGSILGAVSGLTAEP